MVPCYWGCACYLTLWNRRSARHRCRTQLAQMGRSRAATFSQTNVIGEASSRRHRLLGAAQLNPHERRSRRGLAARIASSKRSAERRAQGAGVPSGSSAAPSSSPQAASITHQGCTVSTVAHGVITVP